MTGDDAFVDGVVMMPESLSLRSPPRFLVTVVVRLLYLKTPKTRICGETFGQGRFEPRYLFHTVQVIVYFEGEVCWEKNCHTVQVIVPFEGEVWEKNGAGPC